MNQATFKQAKTLLQERHEIEKELSIWEGTLLKVENLCYSSQPWNKDISTHLKSNVPENIFSGFRDSAIAALRLRIEEIKKEFESI